MKTIELNERALKLFREEFLRNAYEWYDKASERVSKETLERFEIGASRPTLMDRLRVDDSKLLEADLKIIDSERRLRDKFLNRLVIPIRDEFNNLVGFAGRSHKDTGAKYINTASSETFEKGKILYGLNRSFESILREGHCILVEGYFGVMQLSSKRINNVVASCGTSLTDGQAELLSRYTDYVYICYDGDSAGKISTLRAVGKLLKAGLRSFIVSLPDGLDPDEYVKTYGVKTFEKLLLDAVPEWKLVVKHSRQEGSLPILQQWGEALKGKNFEEDFLRRLPKNVCKMVFNNNKNN